MNNFEKNLLNKLLDKYENSKLSKGGTEINRQIKLTTKDDVLKSYTGLNSFKYVDDNDAVIRKLENKGYIKSVYEEDTFKSLTLNLDHVDEVYDYLNRKKPTEEFSNIKKILRSYKFDGFMEDFINYVLEYIDSKFSYPKIYFNDSKQLNLILITFKEIFELKEEIKIRDFSAKYLGDSKLFETIKPKIIKIIKDFDGNEYDSDDDVLSSYNLVKNSSYALIKNGLTFRLNGTIIDLDEFAFEFSLSDEMIDKMEILKLRVKKVITIENLTSFYSFEDEDALVIYLAGFHNHTKQKLLTKIYEKNPNIEFYHFGDIDAGGFMIFMNLRNKTKMPFIPYKMGIEELIENKNNLKKLTDNDKRRLQILLKSDDYLIFYEVISYMLDKNIKLEQEILD